MVAFVSNFLPGLIDSMDLIGTMGSVLTMVKKKGLILITSHCTMFVISRREGVNSSSVSECTMYEMANI